MTAMELLLLVSLCAAAPFNPTNLVSEMKIWRKILWLRRM